MNKVTFSQTIQRYSSFHYNLSAKIINKVQFVITKVALIYSKYCMLLSKTFVVNALGMLAIPHKKAKS